MAKKTYRGNKFVNQKRAVTVFIAIFISFSLLASSVMWMFDGYGSQVTTAGAGNNTTIDTTGLENSVKSLVEQVYKDPTDLQLQESLGLSYYQLADAYMKKNDPKAKETFLKAIEPFNKVIKAKPNNKETLGDLATVYFYSDQIDLAIDTVQKALKVDPNFSTARVNYGIYLGFGKQNYDLAIKELEKISSTDPQYSQAQGLIAQFKQAKAQPVAGNNIKVTPGNGTTSDTAYGNGATTTVQGDTYKK